MRKKGHNFIPTGQLSINDLYNVNVQLSDFTHYWREIGLTLGIKSCGTLERIRCKYLHDIDMCFTEALASWLKGEDRPYHSPGPNWEEMVEALRSIVRNSGDCTTEELIQRLTGKM